MKTMFAVVYEDVAGSNVMIPIAVCEDEATAWRYADVMPFESNVTEVIVIEPDSTVAKNVKSIGKEINDTWDKLVTSVTSKEDDKDIDVR